MTKILQIDYDEYQNLLNIVKTQEELIKEFKKDRRVILIDERYSYRTMHSFQSIPKVIGDEVLIKEFLNAEYETAANLLAEMTLSNFKLKARIENLERKDKKEDGFFKSLFKS